MEHYSVVQATASHYENEKQRLNEKQKLNEKQRLNEKQKLNENRG